MLKSLFQLFEIELCLKALVHDPFSHPRDGEKRSPSEVAPGRLRCHRRGPIGLGIGGASGDLEAAALRSMWRPFTRSGGKQKVSGRMVLPIAVQRLDFEKRHRVNYGEGVAATCGEGSVDAVQGSAEVAAVPAFAGISPSPGLSPCLRPDPVRTAA